ncbi:MAG: energy transducer TonB [Nannocystaceae bacterium]
MFTGFDPSRRDTVFERRRGVSYLLAVAIYLAAGGYGVFLHHQKGEQVDVLLEPEISDFVAEEAVEEEPEPEPEEEAPPPPPEAPPPKPKPKAKPKPQPKIPDDIPDGPPPEAETARSDKEYGTGQGGTGTGTKPAKPKAEKPKPKPKEEPPKPKVEKKKIDPTKPIDRPERSTPPKPDPGNKTPEYPKSLRDEGIEGQIVIKLHVSNDGSVKGMKVLRKKNTATGEEAQDKANKLFLKAVVAAVKTWKYTPCKYQGQAISVWIPVTIPFKLKAG